MKSLNVSQVSETITVTRKASLVNNTLIPLARPVLKWAGGKTQLLPEIFARLPKSFNTYHEPFIGSGAVFFALAPSSATISDANSNLTSLYEHIKTSTCDLHQSLVDLEDAFNSLAPEKKSDFYYEKRKAFNAGSTTDVQKSALMVFLNKTGFNGMYRENPKGEFNIPFAKKERVSLPTIDHLEQCKSILENSEILHSGFDSVVSRAEKNDFVYFDPPYVPLSKTSSFTSYQANGFSISDHEKLADVFASLHAAGVHVLLSNSDTPQVRALFKDFIVENVYARRNINSKASGRGVVAEVLVRNY